jgi:hypothetical protein
VKKVISIAAIAAALLLTGCSQISSAASVGSVKISQSTVQASIVEQVGGPSGLPTALVGAGIASVDFDLYLQSIIISDKLGQGLAASGVPADQIGSAIQQLVVDTAKENKVTINPRYGVWDEVNADVISIDSAGSAVAPSTE